MNRINLLDCTLRDGGYINNWEFGEDAIREIPNVLAYDAGVDIVEVGFLKKGDYQRGRAVFNSMKAASAAVFPKNQGVLYAVMVSLGEPFPLEELEPAGPDTVDMIRVMVWKTMTKPDGTIINVLNDAFEYCKGIVEKGYKLSIQLSWVHRYNLEEFVNVIKLFNHLKPYSFYVADSTGSQSFQSLKPYFELAEENLAPETLLGYHGHNNFCQAGQIAQEFTKLEHKRGILVDASIFGMGRGAGNLCLELFAQFLNDEYGRDIQIDPILKLYDKYIDPLYKKYAWGYSIPNYIAAKYRAHPNYITVFQEYGLTAVQMGEILSTFPENTKAAFMRINAVNAVNTYLEKKRADC